MNLTNQKQLMLLKLIKPYIKQIAEVFLSKCYIIGYNAWFVIEHRGIVGRGYWYGKVLFDLQNGDDKASSEAKLKWLVDKYYTILLKIAAEIQGGKITYIKNRDLYDILVEARKNQKLYQLLEWLVKKLIQVVNAVLKEENNVIANGVLSYNPNTVGRKLVNAVIKNYKEVVVNKFETYKYLLKTK